MDKGRRGRLRRYSSLDESPQNSLLHKIVEYHDKRRSIGDNTRVHSLRCAFAACHSASEEKSASMEPNIPETAEEILRNLGLSRNQPRIPERFLEDFEERFKDFPDLDSRILSSVEDFRRRRCSFDKKTPSSIYVENAKNSEKISLNLGKRRYLTRSKTLMSLHMDSDVNTMTNIIDSGDVKTSSSEDSDQNPSEYTGKINFPEESNEEVSKLDQIETNAFRNEVANHISDCEQNKCHNESVTACLNVALSNEIEMDLTTNQNDYARVNSQMEYYDSDSSTYATPSCGSSSRKSNYESDRCPEYPPALRRRSLSCSDVRKLECAIQSEYATLCRDFKKFRGLNASDSDIQITLNSPARRPYNKYSSLFTSDSEDDDILCVILPAIKDNEPKTLPQMPINPLPHALKQFNCVRVVESCEDCDLCRANYKDASYIRQISFDKSIAQKISRDAERFAKYRVLKGDNDKHVDFVAKNNSCNQTEVISGGSIFSQVKERRQGFECDAMDCIGLKPQDDISTSNHISNKENPTKCDHNVDSAMEETETMKNKSQKQENRPFENITDGKYSIGTSAHFGNKRASTELAELQCVIQNTKVKRECASRQLFLLQELLGKDSGKHPDFFDVPSYCLANPSIDNDVKPKNQWTDSEALSELQLRCGQKEMERANSMSALEKADDEEQKKLARKEQDLTLQLERLQEEMERMRLENEELKSRVGEGKQGTTGLEERQHQDSPLPSADLSFDSTSPPNSPDKHENQLLWKRLKEAEGRAYQAENRSDELNLLLNHKLIEINKLQLTLSSQTKDLIQLEKAYYQLRCHLHRNRKLTSPTVRRISSKLNKTA